MHLGQQIKSGFTYTAKTIPIILHLQSSDLASLKWCQDLTLWEEIWKQKRSPFFWSLPRLWQLSLLCLISQKFGDSMQIYSKWLTELSSKLLFLFHPHTSSICVIFGYIKWLQQIQLAQIAAFNNWLWGSWRQGRISPAGIQSVTGNKHRASVNQATPLSQVQQQ